MPRSTSPITDHGVMRGYCEALVDACVDTALTKHTALTMLSARGIDQSHPGLLGMTDFDQEYIECLFSGKTFDSSKFAD